MTIEIPKDVQDRMRSSIQRYVLETTGETIGNLAADEYLRFFVRELGPVIYNAAVADVQNRLQQRVMEIDGEVYEEPFTFWQKKKSGKA